jgi:DNA-directed RNA polymerase specialized sigma24 family protein
MHKNTDELAAVVFLEPLQKRTRTAKVTAELTALSSLTKSAVLRRVAETDAEKRMAWETLVAVVRAFERVGDCVAADQVLTTLIERVSGRLKAKVATWHGLTPEDREDSVRQMVRILCQEVRKLTPSAELWEANIANCLNKRLITIWHGWNDKRIPTVSRIWEHSDDGGSEALEQVADTHDFFEDVEIAAVVQAFNPGHPKLAQMLMLRMSDFPEEEIAKRLDVTSRTLRNWTVQARLYWEREASHDNT